MRARHGPSSSVLSEVDRAGEFLNDARVPHFVEGTHKAGRVCDGKSVNDGYRSSAGRVIGVDFCARDGASVFPFGFDQTLKSALEINLQVSASGFSSSAEVLFALRTDPERKETGFQQRLANSEHGAYQINL